MKNPFLPYIGILLLASGTASAQSSFQSVIQTGISLPVSSDGTNGTHAGTGIHFGNHLNYVVGRKNFKAGLGVYVGYLNSVSTNDKYKQIGQSLAQKYGFPVSGLTFKESLFKSTHFLAGPVASYQKDHFSINLWAKGGYAFNEPSQYAVIYKENGVVNNIYVNQAGDNKNAIAYNVGAGLNFSITKMVDLQLAANYFGANTDQVNYNFDREKGIAPLYFTAKNNFVQASIGLQLNIGKQSNPASRSTRSNFRNTEMAYDNDAEEADHVVKTKGNVKNQRMSAESPTGTHHSNIYNDTLVFNPEKIEIISTARQTPKMDFGEKMLQPLSTVENYLTAFAFQTRDGAGINQCGVSAENTVAGADVSFYKLPVESNPNIAAWISKKGYDYYQAKSDMGAKKGSDMPTTSKTNADGSFSINNIQPGAYAVTVNKDTLVVNIKESPSEKNNGFRILEIPINECTNANNVIYANNKMLVEVINTNEGSNNVAARKKNLATVKYSELNVQSSGQISAITGEAIAGIVVASTIHNPLSVTNKDFTADFSTIYTLDNKMYAEVTTAREAASGMATGRSVLVTGDLDGDGFNENEIVSPRDPASGLPTGKRMHKPFVITKELDFNENEIVSPRDPASGLPTGKRMHKPFVITKELDFNENEIVSPRDPTSGLPTGKRMHKPFVITKELDFNDEATIVSPRDAASGLPTGKRMHKPFVITMDADNANEILSPRDPASGLPTGKRMHKPYSVLIDPDQNSYEIISPRDPASGMPTGKRMHKPFVITKELDFNDGEAIVSPGDVATGQDAGRRQYQPIIFTHEGITYKIIHRDIAAGNILSDDNVSESIISSPLYQGSGSSGTNPLSENKMAISEQGTPKKKGSKRSVPSESYNPWDFDDTDENTVSNPLYEQSGGSGMNPLFEGKGNLSVTGSNGTDHTIFYPGTLVLNMPDKSGVGQLSGSDTYKVIPVKWMSSENSTSFRKGWDGSVKGSGKSERKGWDGTVKGGSIAERKGWDGTVKGGSIAERKGWDGTVKGGSIAERKGWDGSVKGSGKRQTHSAANAATGGPAACNIKNVSRISCSNGSCSVEAIVEIEGVEYNTIITGKFTKLPQ
ncbi:MAG: hypothetical protein ABIP30_06075 [Ferruginibacter sp.]